jgi:hypothetical protein
MTRMFIKFHGTRVLLVGVTAVGALLCAGFFDGPH